MTAALALPPAPPALSLVRERALLPQSLVEAADSLAIAAPEDLERASLQRRFDHKYLVSLEETAAVLDAVASDYRVVLAGDARFARYDTMYFDTVDLQCFHDHRRRKRPRSKVRVRHYVDRGFSMLEVKQKTSRGDTDKKRWAREGCSLAMTDEEQRLVAQTVPSLGLRGPLVAQARTVFRRLMLVNTRSVERATLDFELVLERDGLRRDVPFIVVEVKDGGRGAPSPLVLALRAAHARLRSFSKYSAAVAALSDERATTLRPLLKALSRGAR